MFLFDAVAKDGAWGFGETLDPAVVASLAERINKPFLLAGGLSDDNRSDYDELAGRLLPRDRRRHERAAPTAR